MSNTSRRTLKRSIMAGCVLFALALCVLLCILNYNSYRTSLYHRYEEYMRNVLRYTASRIDTDDLAECIRTGEHSEKYDELQLVLDGIKQNMDLDFLYVIVPLNTEETDNIMNVIAGVSLDEYENMSDVLVQLNQLTGDSYSPETAGKYLAAYESGELTFFEEKAEWGTEYTGLLPLYDSAGGRVAALCMDVDIREIRGKLIRHAFFILLFTGTLGALFIWLFTRWADANISHPIRRLEEREVETGKMITALASDYRCVYYVDLDTDSGVCYRTDGRDPDMPGAGESFPFQEVFRAYAQHYIAEDYRESFLSFIDPANIREGLGKELIITCRYLISRDGRESYEKLRMAGVRRPEDRDDHMVHAVGVGFTDIDREMRDAMAQSRALSEALEAAENASRAKTAFLSNMSHEIRTPMNAIIGLDTIALADEDVPEKTRGYLQKIGGAARHLLDIINDILDMSRIESGKVTVRKEEFSFTGMLDQVNTMIGEQCSGKGLRYEFEKRGRIDEYYVGDDMKLRQILINILGNAVKFTPEGGTVSFLVEEGARYKGNAAVRFTIRDTGIGMSADFLPKIFESFAQENATSTSIYGSTGLGMTITKNLVEMMNGNIEVESEKGKGSTFRVTVTLLESGRKPEDSGAAAADEPSAETPSGGLAGRRILVAEDMPVNAEILAMLLEGRQMVTERAENGRIALEMYLNHPEGYYAAILMDMRMPEMDGLEATRQIRAAGRADSGSIPIIALTANAFDEDVQRSMQAGLDAHLSKPVEPELLYQTLESMIRRA